MTALKATTIGIASAGGSGGTVYGTYYLVTNSKETETKSTSPKATEQSDLEKLRTWMTTNKCKISVKVGDSAEIDLKTATNPDLAVVKGLLSWLNTESNKTTAGCPANLDSKSTEVSVTLKTTESNKNTFTKQ